ncbi:glycosyltransferase [Leuconostoc lactis]
MNDNKKITVSIVTYNNESSLEQRLNILIPIFKVNNVKKVYIIDNNSQDKTPFILKKFATDEKLIYPILLEQNKGFGYGHNAAIKRISSDYHVVMNLDATPNTKMLFNNMESYMNNKAEVDLLSPLVLFNDYDIQYLTREEPTVFDLAIRFLGKKWFPKRQEKFINLDDGYDHEQIIKNATGCFMFLRTETLKKIGGFDERYFLYMEDSDLTKSINQQGTAIFSPEFKVIHEWQRKNHSLIGSKYMVISMIKYFNKWGWKFW